MSAPARPFRPLVVDLDGTLVLGETSLMSAAAAFAADPGRAILAGLALIGGRAPAKRAFARIARPAAERLPLRGALVMYLEREKRRGRALHLVTGADQAIAAEIAAHTGLFLSARGSDGWVNLKGRNKLAYLMGRFPQGFDYAADSGADLCVWRTLGRAVLVGRAIGFAERLKAEGVDVVATI